MRGVYWASMDKPGAVDVFYSAERCEESDADGTLLHELVHAMRVLSGAHHQRKMGRGYHNSEEFYANDRDDLSIRARTKRRRLCVAPYRSGIGPQAAHGARIDYRPLPPADVAVYCAGASGSGFQPDTSDR